MATTFRQGRVAEAIRETVAAALLEQVKDPRLSQVTITRCEVTGDLGYARLYYTTREADQQDDARQGFVSAAPFLRGRVAHEVPLRVVPEISFHYDQGLDNALRIDSLLSDLPELHNND